MSTCKGVNCTAVNGVGHSSECIRDHEAIYKSIREASDSATDNVTEIKTVDRPHTVALITALENAVEEVAMGNLTPMEVYACLHMVADKYLPRD